MRIPYLRTTQKYFSNYKLQKQLEKENWTFSSNRFRMLSNELADWEKHYLPVDVHGKTILDIGAGEGETAYFYLKHGASKIICVECNRERFKYLVKNQLSHPEIISVFSKFNLNQLLMEHDLCKIDIEGYESALLNTKPQKPLVAEVHGLPLIEDFKNYGGYRVIDQEDEGMYFTSYAYWRC